MFSRKKKPVVLSQTNTVPLNAALFAIEVCEKTFGDPKRVTLKHVKITMEPFQDFVERDGGKVHLFELQGHYEVIDSRGLQLSSFKANILVRLYEDGANPPCVAYEGWHDLTLEHIKMRVKFQAPDRLRFIRLKATELGDEQTGSWHSSNDVLRLEELPHQAVHSRLYAARIRTLGHLKAWTRSQLLEATKDAGAVRGAEEILAHYGYSFKPEPAV